MIFFPKLSALFLLVIPISCIDIIPSTPRSLATCEAKQCSGTSQFQESFTRRCSQMESTMMCNRAKQEAKSKADDMCDSSSSSDCECEGGFRQISCSSISVGSMCTYAVATSYSGTCANENSNNEAPTRAPIQRRPSNPVCFNKPCSGWKRIQRTLAGACNQSSLSSICATASKEAKDIADDKCETPFFPNEDCDCSGDYVRKACWSKPVSGSCQYTAIYQYKGRCEDDDDNVCNETKVCKAWKSRTSERDLPCRSRMRDNFCRNVKNQAKLQADRNCTPSNECACDGDYLTSRCTSSVQNGKCLYSARIFFKGKCDDKEDKEI